MVYSGYNGYIFKKIVQQNIMYVRMSVCYDSALIMASNQNPTKVNNSVDPWDAENGKEYHDALNTEQTTEIKLYCENMVQNSATNHRKDTPRVKTLNGHYGVKSNKKRRPYSSDVNVSATLSSNESLNNFDGQRKNSKSSHKKNIRTRHCEKQIASEEFLSTKSNESSKHSSETDDVKGMGLKIRGSMSEEHVRIQERQLHRKNRRRISRIERQNSVESEDISQSFVLSNPRPRRPQRANTNQSQCSNRNLPPQGVLHRASSVDVVYRDTQSKNPKPGYWRQSDYVYTNNEIPSNIGDYYTNYNMKGRQSKGGIRSFFTRLAGSLENIFKSKKSSKNYYKNTTVNHSLQNNYVDKTFSDPIGKPLAPELPRHPPNFKNVKKRKNSTQNRRPFSEINDSTSTNKAIGEVLSRSIVSKNTAELHPKQEEEIIIPKLALTARTEYSTIYNEINGDETDDTNRYNGSTKSSTGHQGKYMSEATKRESPSLRRKLFLKELGSHVPTPPSQSPPARRRKRVSRSCSMVVEQLPTTKIKEHPKSKHISRANTVITNQSVDNNFVDTEANKLNLSNDSSYFSQENLNVGNVVEDDVFVPKQRARKNNGVSDVCDGEKRIKQSTVGSDCENLDNIPRPPPRKTLLLSRSSSDSANMSDESVPNKSVSLCDLSKREVSIIKEAESFEMIMKQLDNLTIEIGCGQKHLKRRVSDSKIILGRKRRVVKSRQVPVRARRTSKTFSDEDDNNEDSLSDAVIKQKSVSLCNLTHMTHNNLKRKDSWASNVSLRLNQLIDNKSSTEKISSFSSNDDNSFSEHKTERLRTKRKKLTKRPPKLKPPLIVDTTSKVRHNNKPLTIIASPIIPTNDCNISFEDLEKDFEEFAQKVREKNERTKKTTRE